MASTYTTNLGFEKVATGEQANTWGETVRTNLELIEDAISGLTTINTTGGDTTLTDTDGAADQSRAAALLVTGTLTSAANIIVPAVDKLYDITNSTSGDYAVNIKTSAGSAKEIPQGYSMRVRVDSSNAVTFVTPAASATGYVEILDEDDFASDSATRAPSQQSVKAYASTYTSSRLSMLKNYIINPGMRISQQNGTSAGTASGYYPVDQWTLEFSHDGAMSVQQVASATQGGSPNRIRTTVTTADATISAGQFAAYIQKIEGSRISDAKWGTSGAIDLVVRLGLNFPSGTYQVAAVNNGVTASVTATVTVSGGEDNTDVEKTCVLTGPTSGSWQETTGVGVRLYVYLADATYAPSLTLNDTYDLFDVGLYLDPDSTGVAPPFVLPDYEDDLHACMRYYETHTDTDNYFGWQASASDSFRNWYLPYKVPKRTSSPTVSASGGVGASISWSANQQFAVGNYNSGDTTTSRSFTSYTVNDRM